MTADTNRISSRSLTSIRKSMVSPPRVSRAGPAEASPPVTRRSAAVQRRPQTIISGPGRSWSVTRRSTGRPTTASGEASTVSQRGWFRTRARRSTRSTTAQAAAKISPAAASPRATGLRVFAGRIKVRDPVRG
jgi:hypothetical protein